MNDSIGIESNGVSIVSASSFTLDEGKINVIFGESGIGKSLISKTLFGLMKGSTLDIKINNVEYNKFIEESDTYKKARDSFYVFQEPSSYFNPLMTIEDQLNEADLSDKFQNETLFNSLWEDEKWKQLLKIFPKDHRPSGGEKQRIYNIFALKKMLLTTEKFFVFDEPTGNLDEFNRDLFLSTLLDIHRTQNHTIILITHDYSIIDYFNTYPTKQKKLIEYKELVKDDDKVHLQRFKTEAYLKLHTLFPKELSNKVEEDVSLVLNKDVRIFDKALQLFQSGKPSDLVLAKGAISYLKAKSGVGKTTIAKILVGLLKAERMSFEIDGIVYNEKTNLSLWKKGIWSNKISLVFQHADRALNSNSTVWEVFKFLPVDNISREKVFNYIKPVFPNIDNNFLNNKILTLSGGQKQRINLLRTFILNTDVIILDEPFTGLDIETMRIVLDLVVDKLNSNVAILLISHNETIFNRIIPSKNIWQLKEIDSKS